MVVMGFWRVADAVLSIPQMEKEEEEKKNNGSCFSLGWDCWA